MLRWQLFPQASFGRWSDERLISTSVSSPRTWMRLKLVGPAEKALEQAFDCTGKEVERVR
jgi:hypothetical protein